jgi:hypothetical protein
MDTIILLYVYICVCFCSIILLINKRKQITDGDGERQHIRTVNEYAVLYRIQIISQFPFFYSQSQSLHVVCELSSNVSLFFKYI